MKNYDKTRTDIIEDTTVPQDVLLLLNKKERALLNYAFSKLNIKQLAKIYQLRASTMRAQLVWRFIELGQKLAYILIFNNEIYPTWDMGTKITNKFFKEPYLNGFNDCKLKVKEVVTNGLQKRQGRKAQ